MPICESGYSSVGVRRLGEGVSKGELADVEDEENPSFPCFWEKNDKELESPLSDGEEDPGGEGALEGHIPSLVLVCRGCHLLNSSLEVAD